MGEFKVFKTKFQANFEKMVVDQTHLFEIEIDKDEFWALYLNSFPNGTNPIYRERSEHDCSCCRHFVKQFGGVVAIKEDKVVSVWDFDAESEIYQPVINALRDYIYSKQVSNVYISDDGKIGTDVNREISDSGIKEWEHFYIRLPIKFVNNSTRSIGDIQGEFRSTRDVLFRSLSDITQDSIETVLELISSNTLYKGAEWDSVLKEFLKLKKEFSGIVSVRQKENYVWVKSVTAGPVLGRIRNHSIGTLLTNISEEMDLDLAVRKYEMIVAPSNYKRPKAIYSQKMLDEAKKSLENEGLLDSLGRRYANLHDVKVNNILFSNKNVVKKTSGGVFEEMKSEIVVDSAKKFSKVEEITISNFVDNVLPTASSVELYLENKHIKNMMSLIAPEIADCKAMFKWDNRFSWAYSGNIADSDIRENVKNAGGSVTGVLRFSIQWNDRGDYNRNDFDAHCIEPSGHHIYFGVKRNPSTTGQLDVDIRCPIQNTPAVENITWAEKKKMQKGAYVFDVHNFSHNGGRSGFKAEIEFDGQVISFDYDKELKNNEIIRVAIVDFDGETFKIKKSLPSTTSSRDIWGLKSNQFVPVSVIMNSPNYWDLQSGIGNKHFFFMLKDCVNPENPNGFYNEFLKEDLMKHKKVMEALGGKMRVKETEEQLSGVGFSSTVRNDVIVKISGQIERVLKIKF